MNAIKKYGTTAVAFGLLAMLSTAAHAQGVDTGASSMNAIRTWLMTWIPIAATILVIVSFILWMAHILRQDFAVRLIVGLVGIGSASYIVGLFGLGT
ncbi:TrbC/VirB2 family protein [Xanthomonas campestris pv. campestris]|uniref:Conjugal transfer protein TraM n=1 Tax=Xanthomonas hortorum pv. pelargonii TaxID=453602 RepID=A0A6V7FG09_9XANT|nr:MULTISPECIES: TrbC/VirB2 family protein [Xanthomonas]MBF9172403.1 TrbC/VirB2 family protein [Xanthomonas campestris pv. campestris]MCE4356172.1 TrbC/VirB2 family protein [Xanthomonas hortorum pv. pelargonii]MDO0848313.1 TrbC/VirB2 family protein [Xanthomonas campestris pv. campestris]MDO0860424.1 TrbC/VirB2 family protein [Xanthomonas campestris pv. campestris]MEB1415800.1 TrbC/VirB2 family protein [Xanthomonas campestris pv. campestris]